MHRSRPTSCLRECYLRKANGHALGLLGRLHPAAVAQGRLGALIEIQALRALALSAPGDQAGPVAALTLGLQVGGRLEECGGLARQFGDQWKVASTATLQRPTSRRRSHAAADLASFGTARLARSPASDRPAFTEPRTQPA
jgi:hypothetical protein